jgi:hypothetical protein
MLEILSIVWLQMLKNEVVENETREVEKQEPVLKPKSIEFNATNFQQYPLWSIKPKGLRETAKWFPSTPVVRQGVC